MKFVRILFKVLIPFIAIAIGIEVAVYLIEHQPHALKQNITTPPALVEIMTAKVSDELIHIPVSGTVQPAKRIELRPEVSGRIIEQSPNLVPGGFFKKGEVLVRIDPRDYQYAVERQNGQVEEARFRLTEEQGRKNVAEREWKLLGKDVETTDAGRQLALRIPHLKRAKASLNAASSSLEEALLNLERTVIRSPFNALVQQERVDIGQLVNPQSMIVSLIGTDQYWVQVSVPVHYLPMIPLPDLEGRHGSRVIVKHRLEKDMFTQWEGKVIRMLSDLETAGRMARLLIAIDDPLGLKRPENKSKIPLLIGAFVQVEIEGKTLHNVVSIPEKALHEGHVWIMKDDNTLEIRPVEVAWNKQGKVLVQSGIDEGERIITSRLSAPISGTKLRISGEDFQEIVQKPQQKN